MRNDASIWIKALKKALRYPKNAKIMIIGIGNSLRGDDQAGPFLIRRLKGKTKAIVLDCGEAPENYAGRITSLQPDTVIIMDAADWGDQAGAIKLLNEAEIANPGFTTHNTSLKLFLDFLKSRLTANFIIIGVQAGRKDFASALSPRVRQSLNKLTSVLITLLGTMERKNSKLKQRA